MAYGLPVISTIPPNVKWQKVYPVKTKELRQMAKAYGQMAKDQELKKWLAKDLPSKSKKFP